jgi:hypothetical protein
MVTLLLERHPDYARSANEHAQAEELYAATVGGVLTVCGELSTRL